MQASSLINNEILLKDIRGKDAVKLFKITTDIRREFAPELKAASKVETELDEIKDKPKRKQLEKELDELKTIEKDIEIDKFLLEELEKYPVTYQALRLYSLIIDSIS